VELGAEFTYLAGCCLAEAGDWEEVVALLGDDEAMQEPQAYEVCPIAACRIRQASGMASSHLRITVEHLGLAIEARTGSDSGR
jgi:hypothetical protein